MYLVSSFLSFSFLVYTYANTCITNVPNPTVRWAGRQGRQVQAKGQGPEGSKIFPGRKSLGKGMKGKGNRHTFYYYKGKKGRGKGRRSCLC